MFSSTVPNISTFLSVTSATESTRGGVQCGGRMKDRGHVCFYANKDRHEIERDIALIGQTKGQLCGGILFVNVYFVTFKVVYYYVV